MTNDDALLDMPLAQFEALRRLAEENPGSHWHFNDCGCCVCLHPGGDKAKGWIIGSDGGADYHEMPHG